MTPKQISEAMQQSATEANNVAHQVATIIAQMVLTKECGIGGAALGCGMAAATILLAGNNISPSHPILANGSQLVGKMGVVMMEACLSYLHKELELYEQSAKNN